MPESESEQVNVTVAKPEAGSVTMPCASAAGDTAAVMVGAVSSIFSVVEAVAVCPAASVAVAEINWFAPSALTVCAAGHCTGGTPPVH